MRRMAIISPKFDSVVAFSKGCDEFTLKNPPPFVPSCLIAICEAAGPIGSSWSPPPSSHVGGDVRAEVLDDALRDLDEREHDGERQQDVQRRAGHVDPEVAQAGDGSRAKAADERDQDGHARCGRHEVLDGERQHLGEIAHRRFAAIRLPVRIRREAGCGVEREIRRHAGEFLRVQGQPALQALDGIDRQQAEQVEEQDRNRVSLPALVDVGLWAEEPVEPAARAGRRPATGWWAGPRRRGPCMPQAAWPQAGGLRCRCRSGGSRWSSRQAVAQEDEPPGEDATSGR